MSFRVLKPKNRMHLIMLIILVVLIELLKVTKIYQIPESWKIELGPLSEQIFLFPKPKKLLFTFTKTLILKIDKVLRQIISAQSYFNHVTYKTSNSFKFSKIEKWYSITYFFKKHDFCRNLIQNL